MYVLIVESPAKAKAIEQYLGKDFKVLSSFGHVRALPNRNGSVDVKNDFQMKYELTERGAAITKELLNGVRNASRLYLATDPDREGEAISWHLYEVFRENKVLPTEVYRIVFNEVTKSAVQNAVKSPRSIDEHLVEAQRLRQALDYLVGFTLSPVLWKKLPGSKSAGRVQSVALRMLCDRENEIGLFKPEEYWTIMIQLTDDSSAKIDTNLICVDGEKLEKISIKSSEQSDEIVQQILTRKFKLSEVKSRDIKQKPNPPFITSTMQQSASTVLGFNVKKTMMVAQKLYEGIDIGGSTHGLITYMRTDASYLSEEAVKSMRSFIGANFDPEYLPSVQVVYKKKVKNAQEAHEAIRPTDVNNTPQKMAPYLTEEQLKLYKLIWERAVASQMSDAVIRSQNISFESPDGKYKTAASCSSTLFDGFHAVSQSYNKKVVNEEVAKFISKLGKDSEYSPSNVVPTQHFTEPPSRYSEASLVKNLEERGIGRPSTYAMVISVLQERGYASIHNKAFVPESRGRLVSGFLVNFFGRYVEYNFTADLEDKLDEVADGLIEWKKVISEFWTSFIANVSEVEKVPVPEILTKVNSSLEGQDIILSNFKVSDQCPKCSEGRLMLNVSRYGVFMGCSRYPDCKFIVNEKSAPDAIEYPHQITEEIVLQKGPYGVYIKYNDKNIGIPSDVNPVEIDEAFAKKLVSIPRSLGESPKDGKEIKIGLGRYGAYILHSSKYYNVAFSEIENIDLQKAVAIIDDYSSHDRNLIANLGNHEGEQVQIRKGRYGPYLKWADVNAPIPKSTDPSDLTLEDGVILIKNRMENLQKKAKVSSKKVTDKASSKNSKVASKSKKDNASEEKASKAKSVRKSASSSSVKKIKKSSLEEKASKAKSTRKSENSSSVRTSILAPGEEESLNNTTKTRSKKNAS